MKKEFWKRALSLGLAMAMTISLCACGKGGDDGQGGGGGLFGGKKDTVDANAALAKENVYKGQNVSLSGLDKDMNISQVTLRDGKIYMLVSKYTWDEETYESEEFYYLYSCNQDGSDYKMIELETPAADEGLDVPAEFDASYSSTYYSSFLLAKDGTIYGVKNTSEEFYSDIEYSYSRKFNICSWDASGKIKYSVPLDGVESDETHWDYVDSIFESADGTPELLIRGEKNYIYHVDTNGNKAGDTAFGDEIDSLFYNYERAFTAKDGQLVVVYHDEEDYSKAYASKVDLKTMKVGEKYQLPSSIMQNWNYDFMAAGAEADIIFTTGYGICSYNFGDADYTKKMDYVNSDFFADNVSAIVELSEDSLFIVYKENWSDDDMIASVFNYVKPEDIPDKKVLVLAGNWLGYDVKKRVIDFNKTSDTSKIVLKDYSQYNTYDDYEAGITKLNNDIITGNMPDLLYVEEYTNMPIESYIAKGLLADIGKLIASDEELSKVDFLTNVFDAYSVDGVLYRIVPQFEVYTYIAKEALVGKGGSWTMDDMKKVLSRMGSDATAFGSEITRNEFMYNVMNFCGTEFVNPATGECNFNSQNFISMLEYAKNLPEQIEYSDDYWETYDWNAEQAKYREEKTLLYRMNMFYFSGIAQAMNGYFGEPVSFVGFPTESGKGSYLMSGGTFAISAKSANIDEAWKFARYYLTEDYQKSVGYFPVQKKIFEEKSKEMMERPFWVDEDGNKQYYDDVFFLNGEEIPVEPLTQAQHDQVVNFIYSVDRTFYNNDAIMNIINEETAAYFKNQKSINDVVSIVQSRVQLYVDENR